MKTKLLVLLTLCALVFSVYGQTSDKAVAGFVAGKVSIKTASGDGKWKQLKKDDSVSEGDTIMTGNASKTTITYNGSEFRINPNTTFVMSSFPGKENGKVEVKSGFAWLKLVNLSGKPFIADTPISTAGVRGTAFAVMYEKKDRMAMNCICEGKVEVTNTGEEGKSKTIEKGTGSAITEGKPDVDTTSYKGEIEKKEALPAFEAKVKKFPILANCLSCHEPKGWKYKNILKDEKYGK